MTALDPTGAEADMPRWWVRSRSRLRGAAHFPESTAAFSRPVRRATTVLALCTMVVVVAVSPRVPDQASYLATGWVALLLAGPALVFSVVAARRAGPAGDVVFWRRWTIANAALIANGAGVIIVARDDVWGLRALAPVAVGVSVGLFMVCNTTLMRRRSGGRSVVLDAVETAIASTVLVTALELLIGDRLLDSPVAWFTYPCSVALVGCVIGLVWVTVLFHRTPRYHRRVELIGIGLGAAAVMDASVQLAEALSGFTLPAAALNTVHQLTMFALLLVPLHASRVSVPGLERFAPQRQVRGTRLPTALTIVAIPLLGALAVARQGQIPWAVPVFTVDVSLLAVLLALRALLALNETKGLYRAVAAVAEERWHLLGELTRNFDGDRHRIAAQLHEQAITSYVTFASYLQSASRVSPAGMPLPETSEQVRADLSRAAERWREFMLAVRPLESETSGQAASLRIAIVAHVLAVTDEEIAPALTVEVDSSLHLDWATEALVLRIVQQAVIHLDRGRLVTRVAVGIAADPEGFEVRVSAEGAERPAGPEGRDGAPGRDVDTVASFVALVDGELHVERSATETVLVVGLRRFGPVRHRPPRLRVVPPGR
jgi:hypothetical protein